MAGLLDIFDDPSAQIGLGLLAAASPRADGAGFGQRMMEGVQGAMAMRKSQQQDKMLQLQMAAAQRKADLTNDFLQRMKDAQDPSYSALQQGAVNGSVGPTTANAARMTALQGNPVATQAAGLNGISPDAMFADLAFNDGKQVGQWMYDRSKPNIEIINGVAVDKNRISAGDSMPVISQNGTASQLIKDPTAPGGWRVIAPNGAMDVAAGYETGKQRAVNAQTLMPETRINPVTMRPYDMTVDQYINGGQKPAPIAPQPQRPMVAGEPLSPFRGNLQDVIQSIQAIPDKAERDAAFGQLSADLKANGGSLPAPVQQRGFAGPGDALREKTAIENQGAFTKKQLEDAAAYKGALDERVQAGGDLNMRLRESLDALDKFKAGGGTEVRSHLAQIVQGFGASPELVTRIANGDLAAQQEFSKLAAQQAMEQLKTIMAGAGRMTQFEFKVFESKNPNLDTDPNATRKIYDFITKTYNRDLTEQKAFESWVDDGKDPARFRSFWAKESARLGYTDPSLKAQKEPGAPQTPAPAQPQPAANSAPPVPVKGMVRNGFKFLGGDPSDKSNWTPVRNPTAFGSVSGG